MQFESIIPTSAQIETLYTQLKNRSHSISHKSVPYFDEHTNFVQNHPYRKWIIVRNTEIAIGNVYIQYNNCEYYKTIAQNNKVAIRNNFSKSKITNIYKDLINQVLR